MGSWWFISFPPRVSLAYVSFTAFEGRDVGHPANYTGAAM